MLMGNVVGSSERTRGKHEFLRADLGRAIGAASQVPFLRSLNHVFVDLCAGDGAPTESSGTSSPLILRGHQMWRGWRGPPIELLLVEKHSKTAAKLLAATRDWARTTVLEQDARELDLPPHTVRYLHADPNTVLGFPLGARLASQLGQHDLTFSTLGCNAGGLKRVGTGQREQWLYDALHFAQHLPESHIAVLITLNRDMAQWAYLSTGPRRWVERTEAAARKKFASWGPGVTITRSTDADFRYALESLAYTEAENLLR
jgi:hypothetical protein